MASIYFNPHEPSTLGRVVLRRVGKKVVFSRPPAARAASNSAASLGARLRFTEAAAYSKGVFDVEARRAPYEEAAAVQEKPVFSVIMADFLRSPLIQAVDTGGYHGHVGDALVVRTRTDLPVARVTLALKALDGSDVEAGEAVAADGEWRYAATKEAPAGSALTLVVTVTDVDNIAVTRTLPLIVA